MDEAAQRCSCNSTSFERVKVERPGRAPLTSPFIACTACGAVYKPTVDWLALEHRRLIDEVAAGAKDYRKPSRMPRPGDRRR